MGKALGRVLPFADGKNKGVIPKIPSDMRLEF